MPGASLVDRIRAALAAAGDPGRAVAQQRYMKSAMPYRGVRLPDVRRIVRSEETRLAAPLDRDAMAQVARTLWDEAEYREERYAALAICRHRRDREDQDPQLLGLYRYFVESGAWWDLVDETAHLVGAILAAHEQEVGPIMRAWARDPDMWVRRVAIISQLGRGAATDTALLADTIVPNLGDGEFFIRKAIGWVAREEARRRPEEISAWLRRNMAAMNMVTLREAVKYLPDGAELMAAYRQSTRRNLPG
jgi:3-methyladenine DNA glycosylase AlkD